MKNYEISEPKKVKKENYDRSDNIILNYNKPSNQNLAIIYEKKEIFSDEKNTLFGSLMHFSLLEDNKKNEIYDLIFKELRKLTEVPVKKDRYILEEEAIYNSEDKNQIKISVIFSFFEKILRENFNEFFSKTKKYQFQIFFAVLRNEDTKIRNIVNCFIRNIYKIGNNSIKEEIKVILKNNLINLLNNQMQPVGLECLLEITLYILVSDGFTNFCESSLFFKETIFPLLNLTNSHLYFNEFKNLFKAFSIYDSRALILILRNLLNLFPKSDTEKKIMALNLVASVIKTKEIHARFAEIENIITQMISYAFQSDHFNLINAVYNFIKDEIIFYLLKQHKNFLVKIFDDFYNLSYTHWNIKKSPEIVCLIDLFMKIDENIYFECVRKYKFKRYRDSFDEQRFLIDEMEFNEINFHEKIVGVRKKSKPLDK